MTISIVSGSPRENSLTHRIALNLYNQLGRTGFTIQLIDLRTHPLPHLQSVFKDGNTTPDEFKELTTQVESSDAFIFVTPEYNGSYSAALKNFTDHYPKQPHKVFGIVTASTGALGGVRAALQLQELIYAWFGIGSPYMLVVPFVDKKFGPDGELQDPAFQVKIDQFIHEFLWLAEKITRE